MKRFLAIPISVLVLIGTLLTTGCSVRFSIFSSAPKEYSKNGITLTLPGNFSETEAEGYDYALESRDVAVMVLKERFSDYEALGVSVSDMTLFDYAGLIITANGLPESTPISTADGLTSFTYEREVDGDEFYYYSVAYKGSDAFWIVQFVCIAKDKNDKQSDFAEYAKSVVVE